MVDNTYKAKDFLSKKRLNSELVRGVLDKIEEDVFRPNDYDLVNVLNEQALEADELNARYRQLKRDDLIRPKSTTRDAWIKKRKPITDVVAAAVKKEQVLSISKKVTFDSIIKFSEKFDLGVESSEGLFLKTSSNILWLKFNLVVCSFLKRPDSLDTARGYANGEGIFVADVNANTFYVSEATVTKALPWLDACDIKAVEVLSRYAPDSNNNMDVVAKCESYFDQISDRYVSNTAIRDNLSIDLRNQRVFSAQFKYLTCRG